MDQYCKYVDMSISLLKLEGDKFYLTLVVYIYMHTSKYRILFFRYI